MAQQLPVECLNEIFEYLEEDKPALHSCLLVNRLCCKICVRILWRNMWNFDLLQRSSKVGFLFLSTLISCLPNESKMVLYNNKIFIPTPTSKQPLFNYPAFCKVLSTYEINKLVNIILIYERYPRTSLSSLSDHECCLVENEIIKMFITQIYSLKKLTYFHQNSFTYFSGARDLLELHCNSDLPDDFFYQLSQICHNLQSISISFESKISNWLNDLISLQNNLKSLTLITGLYSNWRSIIPVLAKHSHTITKLQLYAYDRDLSFSFVSLFSNLQEFTLSHPYKNYLSDFREFQYIKFPKLQTLKFPHRCAKPEYIMKFLENNGKNLKKFYISENDKALSLSVAKFCPNLKSLFIIFNNGEIDILKNILINCQYLESIMIWCGIGSYEHYLFESKVLKTIAKYSSNNFCELKICNWSNTDADPIDIESFFMSWENRTPKKSLSFIVIKNIHHNMFESKRNMKIFEKYSNVGICKFATTTIDDVDREEELEYYLS